MDILTYLKRENEKLFDRLETVRESQDPALRKLLLTDIRLHLPVYLAAKAKSLYQALRKVEPEQARVIETHRAEIDAALAAMDGASDANAHEWLQRFDGLCIAVLRHLDDEEHSVFQAARRRLDPRRITELMRVFEAATAPRVA